MKLLNKLKTTRIFSDNKLAAIVIAAVAFVAVSVIAAMNTQTTVKVVLNNNTPSQIETTLPAETTAASIETTVPVQAEVQVETTAQAVENTTTPPPASTETATTAPVTQEQVTTESTTTETTTAAQTSTPPSGSAITSKEEIITLYNTAVNKVKTEATKVTRNFRNCRYDADKSVLPSAVEKMGSSMMEKYIKDDTEPVEYLTKEEIVENFPVPKQEYSSRLTAADVTNATCVDNGTEYEITLYLADSTNPTAGVGVGAACHFMDTTAITSNPAAASMIKKFDAIYEGCVIKCKIDKATNRVTWANFYTPYTIDAVVTIIVELATTVVMSYERDYTITY